MSNSIDNFVKRLRDARNWFNNDGQCCGQVDSVGTCAAPACIFGEALKEFFLAADCIEAQAARIAELEAALRPFSKMFLYPDDLGFETAEDIKSDPDWCSDANDLQHENLFVLRRDIRKARAALTGGKDENSNH